MILSLEDLKALLKITEGDAFLLMMMPIVEEAICQYCNNDFEDIPIYGDFIFSDDSISYTGDELIAGDTIRVYNSYRNNRILSIKTVEPDKLIINETVYPEDRNVTIVRINYPDDIKLPFVQMMNFAFQNYDMGIKSEKVDDYSISYAELINGYPKNIMAGLQHHRKLYRSRCYGNI